MKKSRLIAPSFVIGITFVAILMIRQMGYESPIYVSGQVQINSNIFEKAQEIETLFITLFDADSGIPMPYGAIKYKVPKIKKSSKILDFTITKDNLQVMNPNRALPENFRVKARLDTLGQGGMDKPGDLTGEIKPVEFGKKDVVITIDKLVSL